MTYLYHTEMRLILAVEAGNAHEARVSTRELVADVLKGLPVGASPVGGGNGMDAVGRTIRV